MDAGTPPRLFEIGWFAFADSDPDAGLPAFHKAQFIEFDRAWFPLAELNTPAVNPLSVDAIRYELPFGAELEFILYTFT
jgi:hypothetical protein